MSNKQFTKFVVEIDKQSHRGHNCPTRPRYWRSTEKPVQALNELMNLLVYLLQNPMTGKVDISGNERNFNHQGKKHCFVGEKSVLEQRHSPRPCTPNVEKLEHQK